MFIKGDDDEQREWEGANTWRRRSEWGGELVEMDEDEENLLYSDQELKHLLNAECTHCWKHRI